MPNRAASVAAPKNWVDDAAEGTWPEGPFRTGTPAGALVAAEIAKALRQALDASGQSITSLAGALSVHRSTVYSWLQGSVYIDSYSLAAAEAHFSTRLWPKSIPTI